MRTLIFITVVIAFAIITVLKQRSRENAGKPESTFPALQGSSGVSDEKIVTLIFSFNRNDIADGVESQEIITVEIESKLSRLISSGYICRVEFITVGYYLVVVIHAKSDPERENRKGGLKIWRKQRTQ